MSPSVSGKGTTRSDVVHFADCGKQSMYYCRTYCKKSIYKLWKCKYNKLDIAFAEGHLGDNDE